MSASHQHSGNSCTRGKQNRAAPLRADKPLFGKTVDFLICRIGILVPVIILQVGILVP